MGILHEDFYEVPHDLGNKTWYKWKQRGDLIEEFIGSLNIWDEDGCRVICKSMKMR